MRVALDLQQPALQCHAVRGAQGDRGDDPHRDRPRGRTDEQHRHRGEDHSDEDERIRELGENDRARDVDSSRELLNYEARAERNQRKQRGERDRCTLDVLGELPGDDRVGNAGGAEDPGGSECDDEEESRRQEMTGDLRGLVVRGGPVRPTSYVVLGLFVSGTAVKAIAKGIESAMCTA